MFIQSRQYFSNHRSFQKTCANLDNKALPYCIKCKWNKNTFFLNKGDLVSYFIAQDLFSILDDKNINNLADW